MDEAVVRIVLDEGSRAPSAPRPIAPPAPTTTPPSTQAPPPPPPPPNIDWMKSLIRPELQGPGYNPHVLVEGQSGSGKSMAARHIAMQRMEAGEEVHVADTHSPQSWGGAKQVFQGETAGNDAAKFMLDTLKERIKQSSEAALKGETVDFKPITIVLSDFARLMRETPAMQDALKSLLTEGRKFKIGILADTTEFTGAASGLKGILGARANFGQKAQFYAPTATEGRTVRIGGTGGDIHDVPQLPDYADRRDPGLVKPGTETDLPSDIGPDAAARRAFEKYKYDKDIKERFNVLKDQFEPPEPAEVEQPFDALAVAKARVKREDERAAADAEYKKLKPPEPAEVKLAFDPVEVAKKRIESERQRAAADAEYKKLKPPEVKSGMDSFLEVAESLRGTIGGTFGRIAGIALDVTAHMRRAKDKSSVVGGTAPTSSAPPDQDGERRQRLSGLDATSPFKKAGATAETTSATEGVAAEGAAAGGGMEGLMSGASAAGPYVAAAVAVVGVVVGAIKEGFAEANRMADKYAEYSPQIAQAQAMAEMNTEMHNMRRAQESGGELARFVHEQNEMQNKWEDIKVKLMMQIMPVLTNIATIASTLLGIVNERSVGNIEDPTSFILTERIRRDARGGIETLTSVLEADPMR